MAASHHGWTLIIFSLREQRQRWSRTTYGNASWGEWLHNCKTSYCCRSSQHNRTHSLLAYLLNWLWNINCLINFWNNPNNSMLMTRQGNQCCQHVGCLLNWTIRGMTWKIVSVVYCWCKSRSVARQEHRLRDIWWNLEWLLRCWGEGQHNHLYLWYLCIPSHTSGGAEVGPAQTSLPKLW